MTSAKPGSPGRFRDRGDAPAGAWIGLGVGFLVGSVFAGIGAWWLYDDVTFSAGAVATRGTVVELLRGGKGGARPKVQYAADDGSVHEIVGSVSSSPPAFSVGEEVAVLYRPEDPAAGRIDSFVERRLFPVIFGGIGTIALLVTGGLALASWRSAARRDRARRLGTPVRAVITAIEPDLRVRVGGRHGWRITAEHRPAIGEPLKFVSHRLWEDPNAGFKVGDGVTVYHLPFEPGACAFDLEAAPDRLEKPA